MNRELVLENTAEFVGTFPISREKALILLSSALLIEGL